MTHALVSPRPERFRRAPGTALAEPHGAPQRPERFRPASDTGPAEPHGAQQLLRRSHDPASVHETVANTIAPHVLRMPPGTRLNAQLRRLHQGAITVYSLSYGASVELRIEPSGNSYLVLLAGGAGGSLATDGRIVPLTPAIVSPGTGAVLRWPKDAFVTVIRIPRQMIDNAARLNRDPARGGPVKFHPHLDPAVDKAGPWMSLARTFAGTLETGQIGESPVAMAYFEQLLIHGLLAAQPNSVPESAAPPRAALPPSLVAALAFCERHTGTPPPVAAIAAAGHVSTRTLQSYFRLHLGMTPQTYLREIRLERVHRELVTAAAEGRPVTVTTIAYRHGFRHMGRFALQYRALFGRLPSETLKFSTNAD